MIHDAAHCADYDEKFCPKKCYRAQLTDELKQRTDLIGVPISWAHYKGTKECCLKIIDQAALMGVKQFDDRA